MIILTLKVLFGVGDVKGALNLILVSSTYEHDMIISTFLHNRIKLDEDELKYYEVVLIIICITVLLSVIHI